MSQWASNVILGALVDVRSSPVSDSESRHGNRSGIMLANARLLAVTLLSSLAFGEPAMGQDVAALTIQDILRHLHVVRVVDGPAGGRATVLATNPDERDLLTVQIDCSLTPSYLTIRNDRNRSQDTYALERSVCIAYVEHLRRLDRLR